MLKKGESTSRPIFKTRKSVNVKAKILDKEECQFQSQDPGHEERSNKANKTWKCVNVKANIQDKDGGC
jgi:hypothetical protein